MRGFVQTVPNGTEWHCGYFSTYAGVDSETGAETIFPGVDSYIRDCRTTLHGTVEEIRAKLQSEKDFLEITFKNDAGDTRTFFRAEVYGKEAASV